MVTGVGKEESKVNKKLCDIILVGVKEYFGGFLEHITEQFHVTNQIT